MAFEVAAATPPDAVPTLGREAVAVPFFPARLLWQSVLGAPPAGIPILDGDRLFVALRTGSVVAVSTETGALLWTARVDARGPLASDGARVLVPSDGGLEALDPATGDALWHAPLGPGPVVGLSATAGWVFVGHGGGSLDARRAETGERVWERSTTAPVSTGPRVMADQLFVGLADGTVASFRVTDGEPLWTTRVDGAPAALLASEERLYFGTRSKFFYSVEVDEGRIDWRWRIGAEIIGAPALDERHVYLVALDNQMRALDRRNGAQRWRKPLLARPIGSPVHVGTGVVPAWLAAELRGFAAKDGANQGRYPTDRELGAAPVVVPLPYTRGGEVLVVILANGSTLALQRRVEPPLLPLDAVPGTPVPLTPAQTSPGAPPPLH